MKYALNVLEALRSGGKTAHELRAGLCIDIEDVYAAIAYLDAEEKISFYRSKRMWRLA